MARKTKRTRPVKMSAVAFGKTDDSYVMTAESRNSAPRRAINVRDSYLEDSTRLKNRTTLSGSAASDSHSTAVQTYRRELREAVEAETWEATLEWRTTRASLGAERTIEAEELTRSRTRDLFNRVDDGSSPTAAGRRSRGRGGGGRLGSSGGGGSGAFGRSFGAIDMGASASAKRRGTGSSSSKRGSKLPPPPMEVKAEARRIVDGMREVDRLNAWEADQRLRKVLHHGSDVATVTEHIDRETVADIADLFTTRDDGTLSLVELTAILEDVGHSVSDAEAAFIEGEAKTSEDECGGSGRIVLRRFLAFVVFESEGGDVEAQH
tara:strand:+ start:1460 stop:2425 length:966 start_codon:yes stop_codon:yes gene_type:complete